MSGLGSASKCFQFTAVNWVPNLEKKQGWSTSLGLLRCCFLRHQGELGAKPRKSKDLKYIVLIAPVVFLRSDGLSSALSLYPLTCAGPGAGGVDREAQGWFTRQVFPG